VTEPSARTIHAQARAGYEQPDAYERARPGYPPEAVERLLAETGIAAGCDVLELGAGTGKLTRLLPAGVHVRALEPVQGMRTRLRAAAPGVEVVDGLAEATGLPDGCVDVVLAAQAFHWFRGDEALAEIARVLRPRGRLGLIWNRRDTSVAWVGALDALIDPYQADAPRYASGAWRGAFDRSSAFGPLASARYAHVHELTPAGVVDRVASTSFVAALAPAVLAQVRDSVARLLDEHPDTSGRDRLGFPYATDVFWCERLGQAR
jgi:SAM-dependent methyltransferase